MECWESEQERERKEYKIESETIFFFLRLFVIVIVIALNEFLRVKQSLRRGIAREGERERQKVAEAE